MTQLPATPAPDGPDHLPAPAPDHRRAPYAEALQAYAEAGWLSLGVPGHGATAAGAPDVAAGLGEAALRLDIPPLVDGIDKGPRPTPLDDAMALAADAWGAERAWFLTNGASQGNLAVCLALRELGTSVVVQRSVHSSVVDGLALSGLGARFAHPEVDHALGAAHGVTAAALAEALAAEPGAAAAFVVSPSYFGAVADVAALAAVAHDAGVPLVVDEAWGPHLGFHPGLPARALSAGADLVVSSTHKLGGSLTQSAMLHLGRGPWAERLEAPVDRAFRTLQSTSASALLMYSLDVARRRLVVAGHADIGRSLAAADAIRAGVAGAGRFALVDDRFLASPGVLAVDPLRVVVDVRAGGLSGHEARRALADRHRIHLEMATDAVVVGVIGAGAVPDVDRVVAAFADLPGGVPDAPAPPDLPEPGPAALSVREARFAPSELVPSRVAPGRVAADSLAAYPPGIPNALPGEVLTAETVAFLQRVAASPAGHVRGAIDPAVSVIRVVARR